MAVGECDTFLRVCGSITPLFHLPPQLSLGLRRVSHYVIEVLQRNNGRRCRALLFLGGDLLLVI